MNHRKLLHFILSAYAAIFILGCTKEEKQTEEFSTSFTIQASATPLSDIRIFLFKQGGGNFIKEIKGITSTNSGNSTIFNFNVPVGTYDFVFVGNSQNSLISIFKSKASSNNMYQLNETDTETSQAKEILYGELLSTTIRPNVLNHFELNLIRNVAKLRFVVDQSDLKVASKQSKTQKISLANFSRGIKYNGKLIEELASKSMIGYFNIFQDPLNAQNYISDTIDFIIPANIDNLKSNTFEPTLKVKIDGITRENFAYSSNFIDIPATFVSNKITLIKLKFKYDASLDVSISFTDWESEQKVVEDINAQIIGGKIDSDKTHYSSITDTKVNINSITDAWSEFSDLTISWTRTKGNVTVDLPYTTQSITENISDLSFGAYTYKRTASTYFGDQASSECTIMFFL